MAFTSNTLCRKRANVETQWTTQLLARVTGTLIIFLAFALPKAQSSQGFICPTSLTPKALAVARVVALLDAPMHSDNR